jgi:hypothetical protein
VQDRQHRVPVTRPKAINTARASGVVPIDLRLPDRDVVIATR